MLNQAIPVYSFHLVFIVAVVQKELSMVLAEKAKAAAQFTLRG